MRNIKAIELEKNDNGIITLKPVGFTYGDRINHCQVADYGKGNYGIKFEGEWYDTNKVVYDQVNDILNQD
jgi:hypothetical protein